MTTISVALFLITMALLMLELLLIRVFDVILAPGIGYLMVTLAMFASGLAGGYAAIRRLTVNGVRSKLASLSLVFAGSVVCLRPALNASPHVYEHVPGAALGGMPQGESIPQVA